MNKAVDYVYKAISKLGKDEKKNIRRQTELEKANSGKKTWKTLTAKSKDDFEKLEQQISSKIDATSKDIEAYLKIHEILVIYLGETMIP